MNLLAYCVVNSLDQLISVTFDGACLCVYHSNAGSEAKLDISRMANKNDKKQTLKKQNGKLHHWEDLVETWWHDKQQST